jgi:endonuclease G
MAPSADMATREAQQESFSLANMVPQAPRLNRVLWAHIEEAVRGLADKDGELYVVTGPLFGGNELTSLKGHVLVPTGTFKAIYDPRTGAAGAYIAENDDSQHWIATSIAQLTSLSGIDVFPALPDSIKAAAPVLPKPR